MKLTVIIPMYNESKIIADTANALWEYMNKTFEEYEIIFSDDGSKDASAQIVEALGLENVRVLRCEQNRGKGSAVRQAMLAADGEVRLFTDADLAYGLDVIKRAYDIMISDDKPDMLIGSRNIGKDGYEGYTFKRKLMSKVYIKILCFIGGFKLTDSQCGIKAFDGRCAEQIFSRCCVDGFAFDFEAILRAKKYGKRIAEMPVKIVNHRESSVRPLRDSLKMLGDLRTIKKNVNLK